MSEITYFVALPIILGEDGELFAGDAIEARSGIEACGRAQRLAAAHAGAVAFSRSGDASTGDFEPAVILAKHGNLPADLLDLIGDRS